MSACQFSVNPIIVHNGKNRKHIAVTRASSEPSLQIYGLRVIGQSELTIALHWPTGTDLC